MYDAIVIGDRCTGSPTAMLLARAGYRMVHLDKATFSSEILSTHMITVTSNALTRRWDLLDPVEAASYPPIPKIMFDLGSFSLIGFPKTIEDGMAGIYAPRHILLDKLLMDAAVAAGAELRDDFTLDKLLMDAAVAAGAELRDDFMVKDLLIGGERVTGIRSHGRGGEMVTEETCLVSGTDGMRSPVAWSVETPLSATPPSGTGGYYTYWRGVPMEDLERYTRAQLRRSISGGLPKEATSFQQSNTRASQHVGKIFFTVTQFYRAALEESRIEVLVAQLNAVPLELRGYAYEAVAMGLMQLDCLLPWKNRLQALLAGPGAPFIYPAYIGAGMALARLSRRPEPFLARLDPVLCWLLIDGYGWRYGIFSRQRSLEEKAVPEHLSGYARRAFDQGLGRSIWFSTDANVDRVAATIATFPPARWADLWRGVGFACGYTGGVSRADIEILRRVSGPYRSQLATGTAIAAHARQQAGHPGSHTDLACEVLCELSREMVVRMADLARQTLPIDHSSGELGSTEPAYEIWRQRLEAQFSA